jgi:hypothetical protein
MADATAHFLTLQARETPVSICIRTHAALLREITVDIYELYNETGRRGS